jgi:ketopantoate hydroxymethyltransferase
MADAGTNLQALKNFVVAVKKREYPAAEHSF